MRKDFNEPEESKNFEVYKDIKVREVIRSNRNDQDQDQVANSSKLVSH